MYTTIATEQEYLHRYRIIMVWEIDLYSNIPEEIIVLPRVIICDDDPVMIEMLDKITTISKLAQVISTASSGREVIKKANTYPPDAVLLDINLPDMNGIEIGRRIVRDNPSVKIIFITGHNEYYREAFDLYAYDYISKLILPDRLPKTLKKLEKDCNQHPFELVQNRVWVTTGSRDIFIDKEDIIYIQSLGAKLKVVTIHGNYEFYAALKEWDELLDEAFFKCHRSYVINLERVLEVERGNSATIIMSNGAMIPLSRRRNKEFREIIDDLFLHG